MSNRIVKIIAGASLTAACALTHAQERITLIVGGIEKQIYLPVKLAERLGYFAEQGLNIDLLSENSGVNAEDELLAGSVQGVIGFYDHTIDLQARGKATQSVVQLSQVPGEVELVATRLADVIRSPADFGGRALGVTGLGSSTNFLSLYLAASHGVRLSTLRTIPVGSGNRFIAAMQSGKIDVGMTTEPTASRMLKSGAARVLVDLRSPDDTRRALGGLYPGACLYMQTAWINAHKPEVQKLANALVKALRYLHTHSAAEIAEQIPAAFHAGDKAIYIEALEKGRAMFTSDGRMPVTGPETVLKVLQLYDRTVQGKHIDLSKTFTSEFVAAVP